MLTATAWWIRSQEDDQSGQAIWKGAGELGVRWGSTDFWVCCLDRSLFQYVFVGLNLPHWPRQRGNTVESFVTYLACPLPFALLWFQRIPLLREPKGVGLFVLWREHFSLDNWAVFHVTADSSDSSAWAATAWPVISCNEASGYPTSDRIVTPSLQPWNKCEMR